jgi:hypothetical protein
LTAFLKNFFPVAHRCGGANVEKILVPPNFIFAAVQNLMFLNDLKSFSRLAGGKDRGRPLTGTKIL